MKDTRRAISAIVIIAFSIAAIIGIVALVRPGQFGETEGKILLTTLTVGVESIAVLCYLSLATRPLWWVGVIGGVVSVVAVVTALLLIWSDWDHGGGTFIDNDLKVFGIATTWAATIAQACLLLALMQRRTVKWLLATTFAVAAVFGVMLSIVIGGYNASDAYWRGFGVVAILDVLGTVVLAALGAFGRPSTTRATTTTLDPAVWQRATALATEQGVDPSKLVSDALDALASRSG